MPGPRRQAGGAAEAIDAAEGDGRIDFRQVKRQAVAAAAKEAETSPLCAEEAAGGGDGGLPWSIQAGLAHLSSEECRMKDLIKNHGPPTLYEGKWRPGPFQALAKIIVYQQLAGAAASTIWKRFVALVLRANGLDDAPREGGTEEGMMERFVPVVTPEAVMGLGEEKMRGVGLSQRKTSYIQDLARSFKEGTFDDISDMSDEEQRAKLVSIRTGKMDKPEMLRAAERWKPYRSLASGYLYRLVNSQKGLQKKTKPAVAAEGPRAWAGKSIVPPPSSGAEGADADAESLPV